MTKPTGARIVRRAPLYYAAGADLATDRPAHVRAGSGLACVGRRLAVVQDDANWLALVDPETLHVDALALPPGPGGVRLFGEDRGNKADKLDLEAAATLPDGRLLLVGSGSTPARCCWVVVDPASGTVDVQDQSSVYRQLAAMPGFCGAELNLEGAVVHAGRLYLAQRSNGRQLGPQPRRDALVWLPASVVDGAACDWTGVACHPLPSIGDLAGVRLTLTDLCTRGDELWFAAAAEDSPDAYHDGEVTGSAVGVWTVNSAVAVPITDAKGEVVPVKVEGIAWPPWLPGRCFVVVDHDSVEKPSELLELEVTWDS